MRATNFAITARFRTREEADAAAQDCIRALVYARVSPHLHFWEVVAYDLPEARRILERHRRKAR